MIPVPKLILLLDDDPSHLEDLGQCLLQYGYGILPCLTPEEAIRALRQKPVFAIVDLFLSGERGAELSNNFIRDHLLPRNVPYARMSSAPQLIPKDLLGRWVMHKRQFRENPGELYTLLLSSIEHADQ